MENKYIAYCGLDCAKCEARLATINMDNELRKKVARSWSELNGVEITPEMINCSGCRIDGVKTPYCDSMCPIRKCAMSRGYETCANCDDHNSCKTLAAVTNSSEEALFNLKR